MKKADIGTAAEHYIVAASWLLSPHTDPVPGGAMLVSGGVIRETGTLKELKRRHALPLAEYPDCAIIPGFVNAHTHLELTHFPAWRIRNHAEYHPHRFVDWMILLVKIKRGLADDDFRASLQEGVHICLDSGTTSVGEIVSIPSVADSYPASMLGGRLFFEVLGHDPLRFEKMLERAVAVMPEVETDNIACGVSPHAPYTIGDENYALVRECARSKGLQMAIHLAESEAESELVFSSSGEMADVFYPFVSWSQYLVPPRRRSSTELLFRNGMLQPGMLAIHCVHVSRSDAELLKRQGVTAVLCPRSNERLNVGRAPVALLKKLGVPMVLGTDSLASNDSLSMWDEMRFALDQFSGQFSPAELFAMATSGGASALGFAGTRGTLEVGKRADFQVVGGIKGAKEAGQLAEQIVLHGCTQEVYAGGMRYAR